MLIGAPLHGRAPVIARALAHDAQRLSRALSLVQHDAVVVLALHIPILLNRGVAGIGHADFLSLIDIGRTLHKVGTDAEHLAHLLPAAALIARAAAAPEARYRAGLIMVVPKQRIPTSAGLHVLAPRLEHLA